jgi:formylmethanofuran--tetrahydromethanopterin N-formyltransferase
MRLIREGVTFMVYTSKEKEVNTSPLITTLFERRNPVIVPIIVKEDVSLRLSYLRDFSVLVPSTFGVPEPIGNEIPATGENVDTIILPILGFDRTGRRMGMVPVIMTGSWRKTRMFERSELHSPARNMITCLLMNTISRWTLSSPRRVLSIQKVVINVEINGTKILDTFAEVFPVWVSRIIITAATKKWAYKTALEATGFATSKIGCPCEAGIEQYLTKKETPDNRAGYSILICAEKKTMKSNVALRISPCILPAPTASAFDGFPDAVSRFFLWMHYFGDTYEERCTIGGRKCWKIPIMGGSYVGEERFGTIKGIAGVNFLVMAKNQQSALFGAEAAADAIMGMKGVTTSFAGCIVASGSKMGCNNYRFPLPASTNYQWCPTLKGKIGDSKVPDGVASVYEIVINGVDECSIRTAMKAGIQAATDTGRITYIGASNFEGKLCQYRFHLQDLFR